MWGHFTYTLPKITDILLQMTYISHKYAPQREFKYKHKTYRLMKQQPVNLVALKVHRRGGLVLGPYLDARRLCKVMKHFRGLTLGKLDAIEIDAHLDAAIGVARERSNHCPAA
jgi:hypothetical protein